VVDQLMGMHLLVGWLLLQAHMGLTARVLDAVTRAPLMVSLPAFPSIPTACHALHRFHIQSWRSHEVVLYCRPAWHELHVLCQ